MRSIEVEVSSAQVDRLEEFLGKAWVESELAAYEDFREKHSPINLWSHRHPATSPIIPLLYQYHHPDHAGKERVPFGHWYGQPVQTLTQVVGGIFLLEDYWSLIPENLVADNIRYKVSGAEQFNRFILELLVALDVRQKYKDYRARLLFMDPATARAEPDIELRKGSEEIAVHCRMTGALSHLGMSFDVLQYLFGCFYRLVEDSGYSYRLSINLRERPSTADVDGLVGRFSQAIARGSDVRKVTIGSLCDLELLKLDVPLSGLSLAEINGLLARDPGNLFVQIGGSNPKGEKKATRVAVCSVSARLKKSYEDHIVDAISQAATETPATTPLIAAIHLHRYLGWGEYLGDSANRVRLRQTLEKVLEEHPNMRYVNVSSNRQEFVTLPSDAERVDVKDLEVVNRRLLNKPKPKIYIREDAFSLYPGDEENGEE